MNELGWIVVGAAVRATALAIIGFLAAVALKRRGPSALALTGSTTMVVMVGVTALALSPWPRWWSPHLSEPVAGPTASAVLKPAEAQFIESRVEPVPTLQGDAGASASWSDFAREFRRELASSNPTSQGPPWRWPGWVGSLFLVGLAFALLRLVLGIWAVRSLRSRSQIVDDPPLHEVVTLLRGELGLNQAVEIRQSRELATPATIGWRRPAILLPEGWADWGELERRAVLAHELAHIHRRDYATGLAVQLSLSLHFYHPLVHLLARRLRLEQELAADALGASLTGGRRPYLTALANLALRQDPRPTAWPARPFLPTRGTFLRRIEMLRDPKALQHPPMRRTSRTLTIASLTVIGLLIAGFRGPSGSSQAQDPAPAPAKITGILTGTVTPTNLQPLDPTTASSDIHFAAEIRTTELFQNPQFKQAAAQIPADWPQGIKLLLSGEIDQVVILGFDRTQANPPSFSAFTSQLAIVFRSTKPQEWKTLLGPKVEEIRMNGSVVDYRVATLPPALRFHGLDSQTLLLGTEGDVTSPPIGGYRPKGRHVWDDAWKKAKPGPIRVAFDTRWLSHQVQPGKPQGGAPSLVTSMFAPLFEKAEAYAVTLGVADGLTIDALATSESEQRARRVTDTVQAALALSRNALPDFRRMAEGGPPSVARTTTDLLDAFDSMLEAASVEQDKSVTKLHTSTDAATLLTLAKLLPPTIMASREAARRSGCINNLKQIMLAMHNYHSANDCFPPAVLYGPDGKTPYSWRVALLPYLEKGADLYKEYKFDEPWDGPNNRKLIARMPAVFQCPDDEMATANQFASYFAPTGPDSLFPDRKNGMSLAEILDGTSNTIMVVEAKRPIPWTKPEDIPLIGGLPDPAVGQLHPGGANYGMADGAIRFLKDSIDPRLLRYLFTRAGGEVLSNDAF